MNPVREERSPREPSTPKAAPYGSSPRRGHRLKRTLIWTGIGIFALVVLGGTAAAYFAHQVASIQSRLEQTIDLVPQLRTELEAGEYQSARRTLDLIQVQTAAARETATGPLWRAASNVPVVGSNFRAVSEVAVSADDVATRAAGPLLDRYDSFDWLALSPKDGQVGFRQLQEAAPSIATAENTVRLSYERLVSIDLSKLLPQVADPLRSATEQLRVASDALKTASSAAQLLPSMLGADGPRNYLVLVQNNAETRATGGIPGALAILSTDGGRMALGGHSSAGALGAFKPSIEVDPEQTALYTSRLGTQMQNVNLTPDFPTAASTAKQMWEERDGQVVDGVLALDPVVLGYLLEATGPVDLMDPEVLRLIEGTSLPASLTSDNVVSTLLSEVYREIKVPAEQDAYFAAVAGGVFAAFTNGKGDSAQLMQALTTSTQEHRIYLWSSHAEEQKIIGSTALAGSVNGQDAGGTAFGVYFNDGTGAKMDYYASRTVQLLQSCQRDGYSSYTVRLTLVNNAPVDAASSLPEYVTGGGVFGVEPGRIRTNYVLYGPAQSFVETATVNGDAVPIGAGKHGPRPVGMVTVELAPRETATMDVEFSRVVQDSEPTVQVTPGIASAAQAIIPSTWETCP